MNLIKLKLHSNCIAVRGINRGVICDLQRNQIYELPLKYYDILTSNQEDYMSGIDKAFNGSERIEAIKYFSFLLQKNLVYVVDETENFPELNTDWDFPGIINNAIVEVANDSEHNYQDIFEGLEKVGCIYINFHFYDKIELDSLRNIFNWSNNKIFRNIDILIPYNNSFEYVDLIKFKREYPKIGKIIVHSLETEITNIQQGNIDIIYTEQIIKNNKFCGQVNVNYFTTNIETFTESLKFNSCLNRKVTIAKDGSIKNCLSLNKNFGNIKSKKILNVVSSDPFRELWKINKDVISGCNECEFRYVCIDCRAFLEDPDDQLSKPLKCGYDPKTSTCSEWSKSPLKQNAILQYEL